MWFREGLRVLRVVRFFDEWFTHQEEVFVVWGLGVREGVQRLGLWAQGLVFKD